MKELRVTKNNKEVKIEYNWGDLERKKSFQRQQLTKYLRLTQVFMIKSAQREKFNLYFSRVSC